MSGPGVAGPGSGSSDSRVALSLNTSTKLPRVLTCPHCCELLPGKGPLMAHVAEQHLSSDSARLSQPTLSLLRKLTVYRPTPTPVPRSSSTGRMGTMYKTELAKRMRQKLISKLCLMVPRATTDASDVFNWHPYICIRCGRRFEQQSTRNSHMECTHKNEIISSKLNQAESEDDPDDISDGEDSNCSVGVVGIRSVSSESSMVASASSLNTSTKLPRLLSCPLCCQLLAGKGPLMAHIAERHLSSMAMTGSATSTPPLGCSDEMEGLKMHISMALGGLLDRVPSNLLERGLNSGGSARLSQLTLSLLQKLTAYHPTPTPVPSSSSTGRIGTMYKTQLAKRVRRQLISKPRPTVPLLPCATAGGARGVSGSHLYICIHCERRFEQQSTRNSHMVCTHKNEIISSKSKQVESEDDPDDVSDGEDSNRRAAVMEHRNHIFIKNEKSNEGSTMRGSTVFTDLDWQPTQEIHHIYIEEENVKLEIPERGNMCDPLQVKKEELEYEVESTISDSERESSPVEADCIFGNSGTPTTRHGLEVRRSDAARCTTKWEESCGNENGMRQPVLDCKKASAQLQGLEECRYVRGGHSSLCCSVCHKMFTTKCNLKQHLRVHTGERPYRCSVCSKTFTQRSKLKNHSRLHSGKKPYSCGFCVPNTPI